MTVDQFPPHFPINASNFNTGMGVVLFFIAQERGRVSMTVPRGTSRVHFTPEQFSELCGRLVELHDSMPASERTRP